MSESKRSKAAASKAKDVAQVGLKRNGAPAFAASSQKSHRAVALGNSAVEVHGLKRGGKTAIASYSDQSKGYDIGRNRVHDKATSSGFFNSKHPGTVKGNTVRAERAPFARKESEWNGPEGLRQPL